MNVNELLDVIEKGLKEVQREMVAHLGAEAKAQRAKPVEMRIQDLESKIARLKWDLSSCKSSVALSVMRVESMRGDLAKARAEIRQVQEQLAKTPKRPRTR
jgi:uncharacterized coiled-coil protein SlyX